MLHLSNLKLLDKHYHYLQQILCNKHIYIVGGAIRDILLYTSNKITDVDLTLAGDPNDIYAHITDKNISLFKTDKFGTITIIPRGKKIKYELTPLRCEGNYSDHRHPGEINWTNDILQDSIRRDFTVNCIYFYLVLEFQIYNKSLTDLNANIANVMKILTDQGYIYLIDQQLLILQKHELISQIFPESTLNKIKLIEMLEKGNAHQYGIKNYNNNNNNKLRILIDPHQGMQDIINRNIKAVGIPDKRFAEDALRIIRAIRFVNIWNQKLSNKERNSNINYFDIETNTWKSMKKNYLLIKYVAKERIKDEIIKALKYNNFFGFIALLEELNMLKFLFPSFAATRNNNQPIRYHPFDTYTHTMLSLHEIEKINSNYLVKLAVLYHDVGKPDQYYLTNLAMTSEERKEFKGSHFHHSSYGCELAQEDLSQIGFSKKEISEINFYIKLHMMPGDILTATPDNISKKIKKLLTSNTVEEINNLLDIAIADRLGQYNPIQPADIEGIMLLKNKLIEIYKSQGAFGMKNLAINGHDIMTHFKLAPGPKIGELLDKSLDRVLEDVPNRNQKEKIMNYLILILNS